jgi:hypothetical protein
MSCSHTENTQDPDQDDKNQSRDEGEELHTDLVSQVFEAVVQHEDEEDRH